MASAFRCPTVRVYGFGTVGQTILDAGTLAAPPGAAVTVPPERQPTANGH